MCLEGGFDKIKKITTDIYIDWQKEIAKKDLSFEYKRNIHYKTSTIYIPFFCILKGHTSKNGASDGSFHYITQIDC